MSAIKVENCSASFQQILNTRTCTKVKQEDKTACVCLFLVLILCSCTGIGATTKKRESWTLAIPNPSQCGQVCLNHRRGPSSTNPTVRIVLLLTLSWQHRPQLVTDTHRRFSQKGRLSGSKCSTYKPHVPSACRTVERRKDQTTAWHSGVSQSALSKGGEVGLITCHLDHWPFGRHEGQNVFSHWTQRARWGGVWFWQHLGWRKQDRWCWRLRTSAPRFHCQICSRVCLLVRPGGAGSSRSMKGRFI